MRVLVILREESFEKKLPKIKGMELNLMHQGTGIPHDNKLAHAPGREHLHSSSRRLKITSF